MAKAMKKGERNRYVWRDAHSGRFVYVEVPDPAVKPRGISVTKIREAVEKSGGGVSMRTKRK
jgi:hypothetical protein